MMASLRPLIAGFAASFILGASPARVAVTHVVRMEGSRFVPAAITIDRGDTVRFVMRSGGPHNVAFRDATGEAAARLRRVMPDTMSDLSGPLLIIPGDTYTIVFTDVPSGTHTYWCIPHLAGGMKGTITVR